MGIVVPNARNARLMATRHKRPYRRGDGGGGEFRNYSYLAEEPIFVADYTNAAFGHGPGGTTPPVLSAATSGLYAAEDWGDLNGEALARLSAISSTGIVCVVNATRVNNTGLECLYFGAAAGAATQATIHGTQFSNGINAQYRDNGLTDRHVAQNMNAGTEDFASYNEGAADLTQQIAFRVKNGNRRIARTPGPLLGNNTTPRTVVAGLDRAAMYVGGWAAGTPYRPSAISTPSFIVVFRDVGWTDVQFDALANGYTPA